MATVSYTVESAEGGRKTVKWASMANGDYGQAFEVPQWARKAVMLVQVAGTFGTGGAVTIQGSLEETPSNWVNQPDFMGTTISITSAGMVELRYPVRWLRPAVSGDASTSLTIYLMLVA